MHRMRRAAEGGPANGPFVVTGSEGAPWASSCNRPWPGQLLGRDGWLAPELTSATACSVCLTRWRRPAPGDDARWRGLQRDRRELAIARANVDGLDIAGEQISVGAASAFRRTDGRTSHTIESAPRSADYQDVRRVRMAEVGIEVLRGIQQLGRSGPANVVAGPTTLRRAQPAAPRASGTQPWKRSRCRTPCRCLGSWGASCWWDRGFRSPG